MSRFWFLSLVLCLVLCSCHDGKEPIRARTGALDLRSGFGAGGTVTLAGEWRFFRGQFLPPSSAGEPLPPGSVDFNLPGLWADVPFPEGPAPAQGFGTFVLDVRLPEDRRGPIALRLRDMSQAYALYVDGAPVASAGQVGISPETEKPLWLPKIALFVPRAETARFVLHVSNYHHRLGGVWYPIEMGDWTTIQEARERSVVIDLFLFAAIFILGVYHLALFALRRDERSALFFALFCLVFSLRILLTGEKYLIHLFPDLSWALLVKLEYLGFYCSVPIFACFIYSVYPDEFDRRVLQAIVWIGAVFAVAILFLPPILFTRTLDPYQVFTVVSCLYALYALTLAVRRGRQGARSFLASFFVLFAVAVNDILNSQFIIQSFYMTPVGIVLFVLTQAILLSARLSGAFARLESLSATLETQVEERTAELTKLSEVARTITSTTDLRKIMDIVADYLLVQFGIEGTMLQLVDSSGKSMRFFYSNFKEFHTEAIQRYVEGFAFELGPESGTAWQIIRRRKPLYFPHFTDRELKLDEPLMELVRTASISSALLIPLRIQDENVGLMHFSSYSKPLKLTRAAIGSISRFCDQIAGALQASSLLQQARTAREKSDALLLNILPEQVAEELKERGNVKPVLYESVSIMFTDFKNFSGTASKMEPQELVQELDLIFEQFDVIMHKYNLEKLKTIGDAYMCAGGLPGPNLTHPVDVCLAAVEMQAIIARIREGRRQSGQRDFWELRIGIHTGPVVAGVIGKNKFAYDVWGDAVNVAARMESSGAASRINVSSTTYDLVRDFFDAEYRGPVEIKNLGTMEMYFLGSIRSGLAAPGDARVPGPGFQQLYATMGARGSA